MLTILLQYSIYFFGFLDRELQAQALGVGQKSPTRSIHLEPTHNEIKTREIYTLHVTIKIFYEKKGARKK